MQALIRQKKLQVTEALIRESLLRQLSYSVKELQLQYSQTDEVFKTNDACNSIIIILEAIFLHGLKKGIFRAALKTMGAAEETKPEPSFWSIVSSYTHKDTLATIKNLSQIKTDVGRCRVWLRIALNRMEITSYLQAIEKEKRPISGSYNSFAFLRDREMCDTACKLLDGIVNVQFDIPVNSSILNTWNAEPLIMSGIWSPSLKIPLSTATDAAEGLEVDAVDDDTCSIKTSSSITTLSTILALDESQALKIILDAPLKRPDRENSYLAPQPPSKSQSIESSIKEDEKEQGDKEEDDKPLLDIGPTEMGNSLSSARGWSSDVEEGKEERVVQNDEVVKVEEPKTFSSLLESYTQSPRDDDNYKTILQKMVQPTVKEPVDPLDFEVFTNKGNTYEEHMLKIVREKGLKAQNYTCSSCQLSIGLNYDEARFCNFTGNYYCNNCHSNETSIIPSRLIYNWDHKSYPVCVTANSYLTLIFNEFIIDVKKINPKLYSVVTELQHLRTLRFKLNLLRAYLYTCREPIIKELQKKVWPRDYLYESIHKYTLSDLVKVPGGVLTSELDAVVSFARNHVIHCWLCSQKGFICEICQNPKVIYPFDCDSTYRCSKCYSVYHEDCLTTSKNCPKCKRLKQRTATPEVLQDEAEE